MKSTNLIATLLTLIVTAALALTAATAKEKEDPKLLAKAKITRAAAEKTALTKAPDGTVKDAELEEENGRLVWSFDFTRPGTKNITEVSRCAHRQDRARGSRDPERSSRGSQERQSRSGQQKGRQKVTAPRCASRATLRA